MTAERDNGKANYWTKRMVSYSEMVRSNRTVVSKFHHPSLNYPFSMPPFLKYSIVLAYNIYMHLRL